VRILIVNKFARVSGGADRHCLELASALERAGHQVVFLSTDDDPEVCNGTFVPCSATLRSRATLTLRDAQRAARRSVWNSTAARATNLLLHDFAPDVVHLHKLYPQLSVAPVVAARRLGVPLVQTVHDYELLTGRPLDDGSRQASPVSSRWSDRALSAALWQVQRRVHVPAVDAWVAGSRYVAERYAQAGILPSVLALPVLVPPELVVTFRERHGVAYVGRLSAEKGVLDLLELARRAPQLEVTLAGSGPLAPRLESAARAVPNLRLTGQLQPAQIWALLARSRLVAVPSRWSEPVGLAALEAMGLGTPVVAYAVGGLAEEVSRAGGGVLTPPAPEKLAMQCVRLHDDEQRWSALSAAGASHVACAHDPARYVEALTRIYAGAGAAT
jgi:glycosyltransferase involved in cell wall biosynthesis